MDRLVKKLAKTVWDYGLMHHDMKKVDAIIVFGSYNPIVGKRAAELYKAGYAPIVVFSGKFSDSTSVWEKTEAETIANIAIENGLPKNKILLEKEATNSGENTTFTKKLLSNMGIHPKKIIVVHKPYAERRAYATVRAQWPEVDVVVTSPNITFDEYMKSSPHGAVGSIETMVGDLQRVKIYPQKGFQIVQKIPKKVWNAYEKLVELGFGKWLIS